MMRAIKQIGAAVMSFAILFGIQAPSWAACVASGILMPATLSLAPGATAKLPIVLGAGAPTGGITVTLTSNDSSKATVSPTSFAIPAGTTAPPISVAISGIGAGSATITASAPGLANATALITVGTPPPSSIILPTAPTIILGSAISFPVTLAAPAPAGGVTLTLTSSDPTIVTLTQTSLVFSQGSTTSGSTVSQAYGFKTGAATITATAPGLGSVNVSVPVQPQTGISATWDGACLVLTTLYGNTGHFQAMSYTLNSPVPITLNATLFFGPDCDPSYGEDNMNDFQTLNSPGGSVQGFSHHPDDFPTSAEYWFGPRTADGLCYPGSPCSGCVHYSASTPGC